MVELVEIILSREMGPEAAVLEAERRMVMTSCYPYWEAPGAEALGLRVVVEEPAGAHC